MKNFLALLFKIIFGLLLGSALAVILISLYAANISTETYIIVAIFTISLILISQSIFNLFLLLYAWEDADRAKNDRTPEILASPHLSFTALVPVRQEEKVIKDTIEAISNINYPESLKEILVIARFDDEKTIAKVSETIALINKPNIKLVTFYDLPINKPHSLNVGLAKASKEIIVVFDAEDQPHKDIYRVINTVFEQKKADIVQSGVQLMNYRSSWFSALNVLEYFFWFKSTLHFFAKIGMVPLGGNTVFFKRKLLERMNGWDEKCLTEDAEIGIRLSSEGAKIAIVYDEAYTTQEETPPNLSSFIKQRTRWNQGFIQVFFKGHWTKLPKLSQKFLAVYILLSPELLSILFFLIPISIATTFILKLPVLLALMSLVPIFLLILQLIVYNVGLFEFTRSYKLKYTPIVPLITITTFVPFQIILGFSALRSVLRAIKGDGSWEKTAHTNAHRKKPASFTKLARA